METRWKKVSGTALEEIEPANLRCREDQEKREKGRGGQSRGIRWVCNDKALAVPVSNPKPVWAPAAVRELLLVGRSDNDVINHVDSIGRSLVCRIPMRLLYPVRSRFYITVSNNSILEGGK